MLSIFPKLSGNRPRPAPWNTAAPVREELFGVDRLEQHAASLAAAQTVTLKPPAVLSLRARLNENAIVLLQAYMANAAELENGRSVVIAAEWLLDNYHYVEAQIREIEDDLPTGYYRQLPKLAAGPFAGYPRVFGLTWAFVAHTDSHFDDQALQRFLIAYQRVQPLTIGELWAVAITLRIVLVENLRRLTDQITTGRAIRADADTLADKLLATGSSLSALDADILTRSSGDLSERFAAQLAKRLRDQDPRTTPTLGWLEARLQSQGTSIDDAVLHSQQRQVASNVSVRNVITSMRRISDFDWAGFVESISLVDAHLAGHSDFLGMDFSTRNLYRNAIEELSRGSAYSEIDVADQALIAARASAGLVRASDPGYHLIAEGRPALERAIGFRAPFRLRICRLNIALGITGYVGWILLVTSALLAVSLWSLSGPTVPLVALALLGLFGFLPATEVATALVNRAITWSFGASLLPGLELTDGVPPAMRTLVVMPTLLTSEADLIEQIERLEVHYLAGSGGDIAFALLSDGVDAPAQTMPGDAHLLDVATRAIARLNQLHGPGPGSDRFLHLHRARQFNPSENVWMGWERKRGKLHELNRLLRGATDTSFTPVDAIEHAVPVNVRYVITLDADTRLPRDAALRLIGKMAHPLNRPQFSAAEQRVTQGYAILQPRVTPSLPLGRVGSLYQRITSGPGGMDPYAAAVSDVYQDLFGEGSYAGKGIYDVDAFEASLVGRVSDNTMLSHDLFEGVFARAGLASDVEVVEEFPSRYDVAAKRQHRWTRGDWQLLPWIFGPTGNSMAIPAMGRLKMLDNLRRSLIAPSMLLAFGISWLLPVPVAVWSAILLVAAIAMPALIPVICSFLPNRAGVHLHNHLSTVWADARVAALQTFYGLALLPNSAWRMGDAIVRTLTRMFVTRRHLLEWVTAAQSSGRPLPGLQGFVRDMSGGTLLALALPVLAVVAVPSSWPVILPFALLWLSAPALALFASEERTNAGALALSAGAGRDLRLIARRTWRFFETFAVAADHMLPPDNFQEDPKPIVARRTSPTNMGLYMLATVTARDFGWTGTGAALDRLEAALDTMGKLARFKGHFFNWYSTADLRPLDPAYVSSVDSGNLAGHLIVIAQTCEEWLAEREIRCIPQGMTDALDLAREALEARADVSKTQKQLLSTLFDSIREHLDHAPDEGAPFQIPNQLIAEAANLARAIVPGDATETGDLTYWIDALQRAAAEHEGDVQGQSEAPGQLSARLTTIADAARAMAMEMDFAFLLDPDRKLLSIGYSVPDNRLDTSCYDLLASEARLASLFAIAKGDAPTRHWFRLGRAATPLGQGSALISWSGSMFEYLMPSLVMRAPSGSLLDQTNRLVVARQEAYGRSNGIPWGISESAYNARDMEFTYQYSNFGVPGLGLKRGLADNLVIAPYATGLATMVDPQGALRNYASLRAMGALGRYGFYEALDFTRTRLQPGQNVAVVRTFMAHHQGMTIVAIANVLQDGRVRARFHREPMIQACELLLQERMPRDVAVSHPRAEEVKASSTNASGKDPVLRRVAGASIGAPVTHLLSNGRYAVMLTATGAGYSRWRDMAVTRWKEDSTRDDYGHFIFLRDIRSGITWSACAQPLGTSAEFSEVTFGEDHAQFVRVDGSLTTTMHVLVSSEDDSEVRRISVANTGRRTRDIEITSYAEIVLATAAADNAHPAFSKMSVQTEYLAGPGALVATRRPRTQNEAPAWAAHFAVVEGDTTAAPEYETDRARFIGRGRSVATAAAIEGDVPLSNTTGTVLDPIFSLRQRISVAPGKVRRIAFWTLMASSQSELLDLIDKHNDRNAFDRAKTLAWTQGQVQLRHFDIDTNEAADFQRLAAPLLYADTRFRATSEAIVRGAGPQSALWQHSISGDLPIVLLRIDDLEDIALVRQLLRAHEYWRMKRLGIDLVIINERSSSYIQDLQIGIETAVRSSQSRPRFGGEDGQGRVYALRADLMSVESRALLQSIARVALVARRGPLASQLARMPLALASLSPALTGLPTGLPMPATTLPARMSSPAILLKQPDDLEFFNGLGGFAGNGTEYVTVLNAGMQTPAPWINVIANPGFGFQVSATGSGFTWAENSRENQITQWSNDPVCDPSAEAFYVRDGVNGIITSPTAQPLRDGGTYIARHGFGYSRFQHHANELAHELVQYVPLADPIKISRLTLRNLSARPRRLTVTAYAEWVLGTSRSASAPFISTEIDDDTGAMLARNRWNIAFSSRVAFTDLSGRQTSWTSDRTEFLGQAGAPAAPLAVSLAGPLTGRTGAGMDPCAALQCLVELAPGESREVVWLTGQCQTAEEARALIVRYRAEPLDGVLNGVMQHWRSMLGAVQIKTPDRSMDIMLNGWLLYQTIACRIMARSAFYQASGAYGFRDQLQDGMALTFAWPEETRRHLLRAAGRQFVEGDVQHWWLPPAGQGVRTRISDDRVWLAYAVATYIGTSGDAAVLDENIPFLEGQLLRPGEHDALFHPMIADETGSLFEHCARGLDQCLTLTGQHGLPLMGTGDWNDGMSRVGEGGKGESVWLAWLLLRTIALFSPFAQKRDPARAARWRKHADSVKKAIETQAWDGAWYRRATYDDGTWLGSQHSDECRIDSIAQSWAVLSGAGDPARAAQAMASFEEHLVRRDDDIALLFAPPFDKTTHDPGYIRGYPPGLRENGGQYSHAAMWAIMAFARMGEGGKAAGLFAMLNPINHARTATQAQRYKVEPYAVAADVYSVAPHAGRGGWTWYTGAAGWMYRSGIEGILGIQREGAFLAICPSIPPEWPSFEATVTAQGSLCRITVTQAPGDQPGHLRAMLDGVPVEATGGKVRVPLDGREHHVTLHLTHAPTSTGGMVADAAVA